MRVIIYVSLIFLCSKAVVCVAQDEILDTNKLPKTVLYFEDYLDRSNEVEDFTSEIGRGYLKNGQYYYENKRHGGGRDDFNTFNIDPTKNYYIEMTFSLVTGRMDLGNGLAFNTCATRWGNGYFFVISADQFFSIYKFTDDIGKDIQEWKFCPQVNTIGKNKLALFAKDAYMYFYVNDALVYRMKRPEYLGTNIGFRTAEASVVAVDRFVIRYDPLPFDIISNAQQGYKKVKLDNNINSSTDDNYPIFSADGKMMLFERVQNMGITEMETKTVMCSEYNDSTQSWSLAKALPTTINQGERPRVSYISPDKNILILNATYEDGKYVSSGGLSISYRTDQGWSQPQPMFINEYENLSWYEACTFSGDNKTMILSVQNKTGYGERDLYVSFRISGTTSWTAPKNLGPIINSFGGETAPYLAPDNRTLYFCSIGKPGYGKRDVFVTRRLDDTWLNWSRPLNLGPEINSSLDDISIAVSGNGDHAFVDQFSSATKSDIAFIGLPESARPKPFAVVRGNIYNKRTNKPIEATVVYGDPKSAGDNGTYKIYNKKDKFELVLVYGASYTITAAAKGYIAEFKRLDLTDTLAKPYQELNMDIYVTPISEGMSVALNTVVFEKDKAEVMESSNSELDYIYDIMLANPGLVIEIQGYTDSGDVNSKEDELSLNRANAVKNYLVSKGISVDRIKTSPYIKSQSTSKDSKTNNRSIKIKILKCNS